MIFVLLSDVHLLNDNPRGRKDNLPDTQMKKLDYVWEYAKSINAFILQAGDFFDVSRNWHLVEKYIRFFEKWKDVESYFIYGQHDTFLYSEKTRHATSLGAISATGRIGLLGKTPLNFRDVETTLVGKTHIYGCNHGQDPPKVTTKGFNILVIHKMIVDEKAWATQEDYAYAPTFLREHKDYDLILCGDMHRQFRFEHKGRYICNTGCISRHESTKYNLAYKPGFYVYDTINRSLEWNEIPHEPASNVISRSHIKEKEKVDSNLEEMIEEIEETEEQGDTVKFEDNLNSFCKSKKINKRVMDLLAEAMDEEVKWEDVRKAI